MWDMIHENEAKRDSETTRHLQIISSLRSQELRNMLGAVIAFREIGQFSDLILQEIRDKVERMIADPLECGGHAKHYDQVAKYYEKKY